MCHDYGEKAGIEIYILTHNDKNATYPEKYIEDFEDQLPVEDRVYFYMMFITMRYLWKDMVWQKRIFTLKELT